MTAFDRGSGALWDRLNDTEAGTGRMAMGMVLVAAMATFWRQAVADAICTSHDDEFSGEIESDLPEDDVKAVADPLSAIHDLRSDQVDELRALPPPEDFQDEWDTVLNDFDSSLDALAEAADAAGSADRQALAAAFQKSQTATDGADQIAKDDGFQVCGQS